MRGFVVALLLLCTAPVAAQTPAETAPAAVAAPPDAGPPERPVADRELEAFVGGAVEAMRLRVGIAGVVVAVVQHDRTRLLAGYGHAHVGSASATPADPQRSLFRIGSISKTFTYTATMQLVEQGALGLDDPVNERLPEALRVPDDGFAEPIRVRHLLTHTAGFEDTALGHLFQRDPARETTLAEYLANHRPRRVRAPGTTSSYSNYGVALLGAVVAHVSGMPFEDYVETKLTGPLGMRDTTFREPGVPAALHPLDGERAARIATGYERRGGTFAPGWFEYIGHGAPAGSVSATAADMTKWMRVHLGDGALDGTRILAAENARQMREPLHRNAPGVDGVGYGFLLESYGPYAAYGHGGATLYFHSAMVLVPELDLGVFVSANTSNAREPVRELARLIVEYVEPRARPQPATAAFEPETLQAYAGAYRSDRRPYSTAEKLVLSLGGDAAVTAASDGTLRVHAGGDTLRYVPIGPHRFQQADGNTRLEFLVGADGRVNGYTYGSGASSADRIGPLETVNTLFGLLGLAALVALVRLVRALRREPKQRRPPRPGLDGVKALAIARALAWLTFVVTAAFAAAGMAAQGNDVVHTYPSSAFRAALWLATLAAATTAGELVALVPVWRSAWRAGPKLAYTFGVLVLGLTAYVLWTWNLVGSGA